MHHSINFHPSLKLLMPIVTIQTTDFHKMVAKMAEIPREQAKTINLRFILWNG